MSHLNFILGSAEDDQASDEQVHPIDAFFEAAQLAGGADHVQKFQREQAPINQRHAAVYKNLAAKATGHAAPTDPAELRKRQSPASIRKYFAEQRAKGKSVPEILNTYTPEARRELAVELAEVAGEFED
jgi:hypothetical protein